jgi:hypothetical protein
LPKSLPAVLNFRYPAAGATKREPSENPSEAVADAVELVIDFVVESLHRGNGSNCYQSRD